MSRIGKHPVKMPAGVTATISAEEIVIKGKLGELKAHLPYGVSVVQENDEIVVRPLSDSKEHRMLWGTMRANIQNMVLGVSEGFKRKLELIGVGYKLKHKVTKLNCHWVTAMISIMNYQKAFNALLHNQLSLN